MMAGIAFVRGQIDGAIDINRQIGVYLDDTAIDRKNTRLNSSHEWISYAVFCLKKKKSVSRRFVGMLLCKSGLLRGMALRLHAWRVGSAQSDMEFGLSETAME